MFNSGIQQQVFQRPKAELCFRPWWDFAEDCALSTMLAIGKKCVKKGLIYWKLCVVSLSLVLDLTLISPHFGLYLHLFGSDRSSRNADVRMFVRLVQVCLEQSTFIFLGQRAIRALRGQSEGNQRAIRE